MQSSEMKQYSITIMKRSAWLALALIGALLSPAAAQQKQLSVVASFSILADFIKQIGGERVVVRAGRQ